ncbi:MAG: histidinolphosphatase [Chaenotheca gracillima]|nr:MAG: histidinolphosphatase [Chaenotheca gracillima]
MVHPGKPSRGCAVCRKRRIKFDVAWRDQNLVAEKSVRRRKNAVERAERERKAERQIVNISSQSVPKVLSQDYEGYAINFFFSSYILLPKDVEVRKGFLDCLHPVWIETSATSPLRLAVAAVASCMLEAWSLLKPDIPLSNSRSWYLKGVEALRKRLQSSEDVGDDVVMASLMLDMYENLRAFWTSTLNKSPHVSGTLAMVENRRRLPFDSETSQQVLLAARSHIVGRALSNAELVPSNISKLEEMTKDVAETPISRLDDLFVEVANLLAVASQIKSDPTVQDVSVSGVLAKATEVDQRLLGWAASLPGDWYPISVSGPECIPQSVRDAGIYQDNCDVYKSIFIAHAFNSYYSTRISVQQTILDCLQHLNKGNVESASLTALEIIQELADDICASIPYHLGDRVTTKRIDDKNVQYPHVAGFSVSDNHLIGAAAYGGWFLAARLAGLLGPTIALRLGQREWILGQLQRLMKVYAFR